MIIHWNEFSLPKNQTKIKWMQAALTRRGYITLNRAAFQAMGQPKAVILLFDPVNSLIGLKPAGLGYENAIPLMRRKDSGDSYRLRAKSFCNYHQISTDHAVVFKNIQRVDDGILVLALRDAVELRGRSSALSPVAGEMSVLPV
jgi:hypothetical protein